MEAQLTLSQFVSLVAKWIQTLFGSQEFLIIAEVSKVKQWNTRLYIELVEYEDNQVVAHAHAVVTDPSVLFGPLRQWKLKLDELKGQQILMKCTTDFHKDYGYQLHVHHIFPEYTLGRIKQKTDSIKEQLIELWVFDLNKKKTLGAPPYHFAIVSSETSEWLKDFFQVLDDFGCQYTYTLYHTAIHGNAANAAVYKTLQDIYKTLDPKEEAQWVRYNMVIIIRGGGGASGIMRHNDFNIAKGICYMPVPVMMAVGHTSDQSILDEVAYASAKTPTDAAYQLVGKYQALSDQIQTMYLDITQWAQQKLQYFAQYIDTRKIDIDTLTQHKIELYTTNVQSWYDYICSSTPDKMLQSGYALLSWKDAQLLSKQQIESLDIGDELIVKAYDKQFLMTITWKA